MGAVLVELIEGRLGGGKTLYAMGRICARLAQGGTVVTNIETLWPGIEAFCLDEYGVVVQPRQLIKVEKEQTAKFWEFAPQGTEELNVLCVLDEAHTAWKRGATKRGADSPVVEFITIARKTWTDVIFIAPTLESVDQQLADYNHFVWRLRDMSKLSLMGIKYPFKQTQWRQFDGDGNFLIDWGMVTRDPRLYKTYNTYHIVREVPRPAGKAERIKLEKKKKRQPMKLVLIIALMVGAFVYGINALTTKYSGTPKPSVATSGKVAPAAAPSKIKLPAPAAVITAPNIPRVRIVQQSYRYCTEGVQVITDEEEFDLGELSTRGMVERIRGRIVQIKRLDGGTDYIVPRPDLGRGSAAVAVHASDMAPVLAAPMPTPLASLPPSLSASEGARITANLHRHAGEALTSPSTGAVRPQTPQTQPRRF